MAMSITPSIPGVGGTGGTGGTQGTGGTGGNEQLLQAIMQMLQQLLQGGGDKQGGGEKGGSQGAGEGGSSGSQPSGGGDASELVNLLKKAESAAKGGEKLTAEEGQKLKELGMNSQQVDSITEGGGQQQSQDAGDIR